MSFTKIVYMLTILVHVILYSNAEDCTNVCYPPYGCFSNCPPFDAFPLPESPDDIGTLFHLYTRRNNGTALDFELIDPDDLGSTFNNSHQTIFLVHGATMNSFDAWVQDVRNVLLQEEEYNVIAVDWRDGAEWLRRNDILTSGANARVVGAIMYSLVVSLQAERSLNREDVHCVGFSLGGQVCAFFGKAANGQIGRITGLDPTGGPFDVDDQEVRLSPEDAHFVDVIHTNANGPGPSTGINRNIGDVDFWANSGRRPQPGCERFLRDYFCNPERAHRLFLASIESECSYNPQPCKTREDMLTGSCDQCTEDNCQEVGFDSVKYTGRGTYYFQTSDIYPFCL